jgi:hypothetical protein
MNALLCPVNEIVLRNRHAEIYHRPIANLSQPWWIFHSSIYIKMKHAYQELSKPEKQTPHAAKK